MHGASGEIATEISLSLSNNFIIDFLFFYFFHFIPIFCYNTFTVSHAMNMRTYAKLCMYGSILVEVLPPTPSLKAIRSRH